MSADDRVRVIQDFEEMLDSLRHAITLAGGDPDPACSIRYLGRVSALEVLSALCTNGIRFHHESRAGSEDEPS